MSDPASTDVNGSPQSTLQHGKFYLHDESVVVLRVENTLHRVAKRGLKQHSRSVLRDMFELPQGDRSQMEGESDDNPITLVGCTNFEFESLLEVLYPEGIKGPKLSKDQWIGALKLARLWDMPEIAALAIEELTKCELTPVEKVSLGKAHGVPSWLKEGYTVLVSDLKATSLQEISGLGLETALRIVWAHVESSQNNQLSDMRQKFCTFCHETQGRVQAIENYTTRCSVCSIIPSGWKDQKLIHVAFPWEALQEPYTGPGLISTDVARKKVEEMFGEELKEAELRNT